MGGARNYFKRELTVDGLYLEHESATDFCVTCYQSNRSILPMLALRTFIFTGCVSILVASMVVMTPTISIGQWFIFLTHWGIILITLTSGIALAVSLRVLLFGSIDATFGLPWYVKLYWVSYNTSIPLAFFITLFYWIFLTGATEDYSFNATLDVFIHAINSVLMLLLVVCSKHPTRLLHFYCSLGLGILYMLFSLIYYYAGAISPFGTVYIYPMLDWSRPAIASITVVGSAVALIIMHALLVGITVLRNALTKSYRKANMFTVN